MKRLIDTYIRNEAEQARVRQAEELAAVFAERAAVHDREGSFPFDNFADLREAGYLKLTVPRAYGGEEISLYEFVMLQERLAYGDGSTALAVGWHLGQILHLRTTGKWPGDTFAELCRSVVKDGTMINTFASEAATGSPSRGGRPSTTAVPADGGWRITGRKTFSTLSPILDRFVVTAYLPDEDSTADFLVHRSDQVTLVETWDTLGMRATGSHDVVLDGAFAARDMRLSGGKGVDDGAGWMLHIPACYMGIALAARDYALAFARSYRPGGMEKPISAIPYVQHTIGEMEVELRTARAVLYAAAERWDNEPDDRPALKPELGLAKYEVTNNAIRIVDLAMRIVGGSSLSRNTPLERYYRDVRAGLHNPPMDNAVLYGLAAAALGEADE
ncbi:acyl-CoA dehydrogenase family protein [Paenibacillus sacheonensis]|uniref:Acyl-CoA dehydrogenase n=1 Tax=Paenibacillus sacheonensis TaxID=742054 RepID=A0A7X4YVT1_9BACL|nr:acyl-CoA dehydrogenase family protein [Paenibacillus sacheonensis]MBM7568617.1 alkylation response protein AidB-like acyl-CoA dehydrogenase [Paenibacillus sacheonensis]NBC72489.1 acyl-CoA dehydrogenase [Paenibacillus sacheonensis]